MVKVLGQVEFVEEGFPVRSPYGATGEFVLGCARHERINCRQASFLNRGGGLRMHAFAE